MDKIDKTYPIYGKIYDLLYELNVICPNILISVLPQLECKLKANHEGERLRKYKNLHILFSILNLLLILYYLFFFIYICTTTIEVVALLARMFSEKGSTLAKQHKGLWDCFLQRFCDIAVPIRVKCVQSTMHFFLNHVEFRDRIIATLKLRQHDSDYIVRYEVVMAIAETAKRDCRFVSESFDLLECVRERTLDKKFKIRKEAMNGLAFIYKKYLADPNVSEVTKNAIQWIKDKILHGYYMTGIEDRLLVCSTYVL